MSDRRLGVMRLSRTGSLLGVVALLSLASASAAELPSRTAAKAAPPAKAQTCDIDGHPGFKLPGSETCMRISGYVSAGVMVGNLKPGYTTH